MQLTETMRLKKQTTNYAVFEADKHASIGFTIYVDAEYMTPPPSEIEVTVRWGTESDEVPM